MKYVRTVILVLVAGWFLLPTVIAAEAEVDKPAVDSKLCELTIEGQFVVQVTLDQIGWIPRRVGSVEPLTESVQLPPGKHHLASGKYLVSHIELENGYECFSGVLNQAEGQKEDSIELAPDRPCVLKVGGPLQPMVVVSRQGKCLELDYDLRDAEGRSYRQSSDKMDWSSPPKFAIYRDGQEIASGSFAYG